MSGRDALPPLSCLRAFETAARHLSFTRASDELHLTQSAVSRQIKRLEQDLGRPLFERAHDGLTLTPAGEQYARVVTVVLRDLRDVSSRLRRLGDENQLTLASSPTIASLWLARLLPNFQFEHPDIDIRILTVEDPHRLNLAEFDLGLYYRVDGLVDPAGMLAETVFGDEPVQALCSPGYLERYGLIKDADDLLEHHTLMVVEDHYRDWLTWPGWFEALGLPWRTPAHQLRANSYQLLMNATLAGQGVTLGWTRLLEEEILAGHLVAALPHRVTSSGVLSLLSPAHRHQPRPARLFRIWLLASINAGRAS